jgi:glycosyltransferase involved in cell wall biosynthesis
MNIVFVSPYPPLQDGLTRYTKQFATELRARGHHVGVISTAGRPNEAENVGAVLGLSPFKLCRVYRFIKQERPEIVHVQYTIPGLGLAALPLWFVLAHARRNLHTKTVVTFHEVKRETALLGALGAWYLRAVARSAEHVIVHTAEAAKLLTTRCGVPQAKISHLLHPLYVYEQTAGSVPALRKTHGLVGKRIVLFFGYIHIDKGIEHLIAGFALARAADKSLADAVLIIAGSVRTREPGLFKWFEHKDRAYEQRLHWLVRHLGIEAQVRFVPYVPDADVTAWFNAATCVVLPYTNLEQSGVLNIALACKTPIIASKLGGLGETLAGTPALVPPKGGEQLARKLCLLLTDAAAQKAITHTYPAITAARTVPVVTAQLEAIYTTIKKEGR